MKLLTQFAAEKLNLNKKSIPILSNKEAFQWLLTHQPIQEHDLLVLAAEHQQQQCLPLSELIIDQNFLKTWPVKHLKQQRIIPIFLDTDTVCFATDHPYNHYFSSDEFTRKFQQRLSLIYITAAELSEFLEQLEFPKTDQSHNILHRLLISAIEKNASDIHISQSQKTTRVQFRIHGELIPSEQISKSKADQLVNLIKIHSHMDISQHTLPQDGHLSFHYQNQQFEFRTATLPTLHGEDLVLRFFRPDMMASRADLPVDSRRDMMTESQSFSTIKNLGYTDRSIKSIERLLQHETGLILVTGSTGSGKTTTLYAFLNYLSQVKKKRIVSLENPIEFDLPNIRQSQINADIGYTFVKGLRSVLRQDPDIIMIGEIRDQETAAVALEAAYTGHLILSTLHTSDVSASLLRLLTFQLDSFLLSQSLRGILSQKLVKTRCTKCTHGCSHCRYRGYVGRTSVSEILEIQSLPHNINPSTDLKKILSDNIFLPFSDDIKEKKSLIYVG